MKCVCGHDADDHLSVLPWPCLIPGCWCHMYQDPDKVTMPDLPPNMAEFEEEF